MNRVCPPTPFFARIHLNVEPADYAEPADSTEPIDLGANRFVSVVHILDQGENHRAAKRRKLILGLNNSMRSLQCDLFGAKPEKQHQDVKFQEDNYFQAKKNGKMTLLPALHALPALPAQSRNTKVKKNLNAAFHDPSIQKGLFD